MCGIAGIFSKEQLNLNTTIENMVKGMSHRGPDAIGYHVESDYAFGHARLSIIDLNKRSNQPFYDQSGRYIIIFNGEIYNFMEIKSQIGDNYKFLTASDTEVILAAYITYGEEVLDILNGCFSFAIYDTKKDKLFLARDRFGIKPLYYSITDKYLIFSSELRSLMLSGIIKKDIDSDGLSQLVKYQSSIAPNTIIKNIKMLKPGTSVVFYKKIFQLKTNKYWAPNIETITRNYDYNQIVKEVRTQILQSVERRMVADVDIAAFLSGGIDSSIIVASLRQISSKKINTFSLVHEESDYDESIYSDLVSKHFNTNHYKIKISKDELIAEVLDALNNFDSPSADGINSYLVSKRIKKVGIKVALSGLGADEIFAGYPQFKYWYYFNKYKSIIPFSIFFNNFNFKNNYAYKINEIIKYKVDCNRFNEIFRNVSGYYGSRILKQDSSLDFSVNNKSFKDLGSISQYTRIEINGYTSNVLLKDADQTSMANSIEVRVPFLDHKLFEFILSLPDDVKNTRIKKKLMIDAFKKEIPKDIYQRKKQGFIVPTNIWMRNELKELSIRNIKVVCDSDLFNKDIVINLWNDYLESGRFGTLVWSLVVFGGWIKKNNIA